MFLNSCSCNITVTYVDALQTADKYKIAAAANWRPGDDVIVSAPAPQELADKRLQEGYECVEWFLYKKKLHLSPFLYMHASNLFHQSAFSGILLCVEGTLTFFLSLESFS